MYNEIKAHIATGDLKTAFEEIHKLPLNREQRDELLFLESGYDDYLEQEGMRTETFQQQTRNRLVKQTILLVNNIADAQAGQAKPLARSVATAAVAPEPIASTRNKTNKLTYPLMIGLGLIAILAALWFFSLENNKGGAEKATTAEATPVEVEEPATTDNDDKEPPGTAVPAKPNDFKAPDLDQYKKPDAVLVNPELLRQKVDLNKISRIELKPSIGLLVYALRMGRRRPSTVINNTMQKVLDEKLSGQRVIVPSIPENFNTSDLVDKILSGKYKDGPITGFNTDYLLIVEIKPASGSRSEYRFFMVSTSTGNYKLNNQSRTFNNSDSNSAAAEIGKVVEYWMKR